MWKWLLGGLVAAAAIGGAVWYEEKKASASNTGPAAITGVLTSGQMTPITLSVSGASGVSEQADYTGNVTSATADNTSAVTVTSSSQGVTITAAAAGSANVTVSWTSTTGAMITSTIAVTVTA